MVWEGDGIFSGAVQVVDHVQVVVIKACVLRIKVEDTVSKQAMLGMDRLPVFSGFC